MPRKQRTPKTKPISTTNNNSDEAPIEEDTKKEFILKSQYKQHQAIKINEATNNI